MISHEDIQWPTNFKEIKELDKLLRCSICYDYMKTPLVTSCSHNYCSLCIRKYMCYKSNCPICSVSVTENMLHNNRILEQIILLFISVRDRIIGNLRDTKSDSLPNNNVNLKNSSEEMADSLSMVERARVPSSLLQKETRCEPQTSGKDADILYIEDDSDEGSEVVGRQDNIQEKMVRNNATPAKSNIPNMFNSKCGLKPATIAKVPCPVCSVEIPERNINFHLDICLKSGNDANKSNVDRPKRKPLPKLVYSLLQEKDLRKKLKDLGLSIQGDRKILISRHQKYTILYNSECDSANPRPVEEIIKQVEKEEREEKKISAASPPGLATRLNIDRKMDPEAIEAAQRKYLVENQSSFQQLIANIRKRGAGCSGITTNNHKTINPDDDATEEIDVVEIGCEEGNKMTTATNIHTATPVKRSPEALGTSRRDSSDSDFDISVTLPKESSIPITYNSDSSTDISYSPILSEKKLKKELSHKGRTLSASPELFGVTPSSKSSQSSCIPPAQVASGPDNEDRYESDASNESISLCANYCPEGETSLQISPVLTSKRSLNLKPEESPKIENDKNSDFELGCDRLLCDSEEELEDIVSVKNRRSKRRRSSVVNDNVSEKRVLRKRVKH